MDKELQAIPLVHVQEPQRQPIAYNERLVHLPLVEQSEFQAFILKTVKNAKGVDRSRDNFVLEVLESDKSRIKHRPRCALHESIFEYW
jgi:hypothetical protein